MHEVCNSFHLRAFHKGAGSKLLLDAGLPGIVFDPTDHGWVTVLAHTEPRIREVPPEIVLRGRYEGVMLHYTYAEDHGWSFALYDEGRNISSYRCYWAPKLQIDKSGLDLEMLVPYLIMETSRESLETLFAMDRLKEIRDGNAAALFADLLGIKFYIHLTGFDLIARKDDILAENPGAEYIDR